MQIERLWVALGFAFAWTAEAAIFDAEIADGELRNALRQIRAVENYAPVPGVDGDAEAGLQKHEDRARGPGLRRAGDGVKRWTLSDAPIDSAEEFGKAVRFDRAAEI